MRMAVLIGALGLTLAAASAQAAPAMPAPHPAQAGNIVDVADGCGRGWHANRWGRCVPSRYGHYRSYRWHSPGDHVANQLNRRELGRIYSGTSGYYRGHRWGY